MPRARAVVGCLAMLLLAPRGAAHADVMVPADYNNCASPPEPNFPPPRPADAGLPTVPPLSPAEALAQTEPLLARMDATLHELHRHVARATDQRDTARAVCVRDKENQVEVYLRSARAHRDGLAAAVTQGDAGLVEHELTIVGVLSQRTDQVVDDAWGCWRQKGCAPPDEPRRRPRAGPAGCAGCALDGGTDGAAAILLALGGALVAASRARGRGRR